MNDLIDRQLAIDAMENADWYHINKDGRLIHGANSEEDEPLYKAEDIYNVLEQLPSAEPEIIRCKDCKHCRREDYDVLTEYGFYNTEISFWCDKLIDVDKEEQVTIMLDDFCSWAERKSDE